MPRRGRAIKIRAMAADFKLVVWVSCFMLREREVEVSSYSLLTLTSHSSLAKSCNFGQSQIIKQLWKF